MFLLYLTNSKISNFNFAFSSQCHEHVSITFFESVLTLACVLVPHVFCFAHTTHFLNTTCRWIFTFLKKMRLAYLEEPETWKRAADILQKLAKNVDIFLQKSNMRFTKKNKVFRHPQFPKKVLYVIRQQKVSFIFESKIAIIFRRSPCRRFSRTSTKSFMSGNWSKRRYEISWKFSLPHRTMEIFWSFSRKTATSTSMPIRTALTVYYSAFSSNVKSTVRN